MTAIQAVIFDMDGTLVEWRERTIKFEKLAASQFSLVHQTLVERGYSLPDVDSFITTLYARAQARWREAMDTCQSFTVRDLLREGLAEMALPVSDKVLDMLVEVFESIPEPTDAKDGARPTLLALQERGLKLGIISNSWSTPTCRDAQLERTYLLDLLPVRVYSSTMEVMKPHPAIFEHALAELGVPATQTVMVGDNLEMDIGGAQGVGMRGVWIDNRGRGLSEDATVQPDARIENLSELLAVLERWRKS